MPLLYLSERMIISMTLDEFLENMITTSVKEASSDAVLPAKLYRKEMDAKLRATLFMLYNIQSEQIW